MDTIKWGKTRSIQKNETDVKSTSSLGEKSNQNSDEKNGYIIIESTNQEKYSNDNIVKKINIEYSENSDDLFYIENTENTENTENIENTENTENTENIENTEKDLDGEYSMDNNQSSSEKTEKDFDGEYSMCNNQSNSENIDISYSKETDV
jgi:hypothetical protein